MKPTEFIVENSVIAQEADDMHRDHEVQMARSQMYSAAQAAIEIHRLLRDISEMEGLEGWVQSKLTLASQYLESVRDYMKYEAVSQESEMMPFAESAAEYALESLISEQGMKDYVGKNSEKFNEPTRDLYARNTARFGGDDGQPGAKGERKSTGPTVDRSGKSVTGFATGVSKPEGVPKVSKIPATRFGGGGGGGLPLELGKKRSLYFDENKRSVRESATGGASSAGAVATSMSGPAHKPTSGVPKRLGNSHKSKQVVVGKGIYDK